MKRMNRFLSIILVAVMTLSSTPLFGMNLFPVESQAASEVYTQSMRFMEKFTQRTSVPSGYVGIYNATDLNNIRNNTSGKYILMDDIDLSSISSWSSFSANGMTLDGNGHKIKNLKSTSKGLISTASGSTVIKNLGIENININSTGNEVGGIVGRAKSVTITNCYVTGSISAKYDVGGICGNYDSDSTAVLTSCYNLADVSASSSYAGGIFGEIDTLQFETITITKCYNGGNVTAASSYAGGIVGYSSGYGDQVKIFTEQCCNTGNIYAKQYAGGITGYETGVFGWMRIVDCFNTGSVSGESYVGGIVGASCKTIMTSYNIGSVSGNKNVDAMVGLTTLTVWDNPRNCSLYNCYYLNTMNSTTNATKLSKEAFRIESSFQPSNTNYPFDFNSIWVIDSNYNEYYPFLRCCNNIKWMFKSETIDTPKDYDLKDSITINVYAIDKNTNDYIPAANADVTIYSGSTRVFTQKSNNEGKIILDRRVLLGIGINEQNINNYTISAHFTLGTDIKSKIELCSEFVAPDGTWMGKTLKWEEQEINLFCEEPRVQISMTVAYAGSDVFHRYWFTSQTRYERICQVMSEYSSKLAQMTNGHVLLERYSVVHAPDNDSMAIKKSDGSITSNCPYDILVFDKAWHPEANRCGFFSDEGHIYSSYSDFDSNTITHETGHYLFGACDEYCYGLGYEYGNFGKNSGYWSTQPGNAVKGRVPRPDGMDWFGVMEDADVSLEMSNAGSYAYLGNQPFDNSRPELYTLHYYNEENFNNHNSVEESLMNFLSYFIDAYGYCCNYSDSSQMPQTVNYSFATVDSNYIAREEIDSSVIYTELSNNYRESLNEIAPISFSYADNILSIKVEDEADVYIKNIAAQETLPVDNHIIELSYDELTSSNYYLIIANDITKEKNTYNIYSAANNSATNVYYYPGATEYHYVIIEGQSTKTYGTKHSIGAWYIFLSSGVEYAGTINSAFLISDSVDLSTVGWARISDVSYEDISSVIEYGTRGIINTSASIAGDGFYALFSNDSSNDTLQSISNLSVSKNDTTYDNQVKVSFNDPNEDTSYYRISYAKKDYYDKTNTFTEEITFENNSEELYIALNNGVGEYVISIQAISDTGATSEEQMTEYSYKEKDSNYDGIPDSWFETYYQLKDVDNVSSDDSDYDGLTNLQEYQLGTNPLSSDTDGDNVPDNIEIKYSLDPTNAVTDGITNDYIIVYGEPEVSVQKVSFNENNLTFNVVNNSDGKAMRSVIAVEADGSTISLWTVNIGANSELTFDVPLESVQNCHNLSITCDEGQITHDTNYNNNTFIYAPAETIAFNAPSYTVVKGSTISPALIVTPEDSNDIIAWKIEGTAAAINSITGLVTAKKIGTATVTANTLDGKTATCEIYCVAFEGAEYSEFDSVRIENNTQVAITGYIGSDADISIPETIGGLPVTTINASAFNGCNISSVYIPDGITTISDTAFGTVTGLQYFTVAPNNTAYISENGVLYSKDYSKLIKFPIGKEINSYSVNDNTKEISSYAFYGASVSELSLDNELTAIGSSAFENCKSLSSITIPEKVNTIGTKSFANCDALKTVNYNSRAASSAGNIISVLWSNATVFANSPVERIIIGQNVESIPGFVFARMSTVKNVDFSSASNLRSIGTYAFVNDSSIESISLPEGLTSIGTYAFSGCSGISSLVLPDSLSSIGNYAFQNCTQIDNLTIHYNVESIGENTFKNCSSLRIICYNNSAAYNNAVANSIPYEIIAVPATGISGNDISVIKGETTELLFTIEPWYSSENVSFESSKTNIATVEGKTLSALKCGYTTITLTTESGITNTFRVNVIGTENAEPVDFDYTVSSDKTSITVNDYTGESKTATIPDTIAGIPVTTIASSFAATGLEDLTIGKNVSTIYVNSFGSAKALENIFVDSNNAAYADIDGVLTDKDKTILMRYPQGRTDVSYSVPETITTIYAYAFSNTRIQEIDFNNAEIASIGRFAFNGSCLREVTIPESVTSLGSSAFGSCDSLITVFYNAIHAKYSRYILSYTCVFPSSVESFIVEDGVKTIPEKMLSNSNISELYLPVSIESIADNAFGSIENLTIKAYANNEYASQYAKSHSYTLEIVTCGNCQFAEWTIVEVPSCMSSGTKMSTCDVCGKETTVEMPLLPHIDEDKDGACDGCGFLSNSYCPLCNRIHSNSIVDRLISFFHHLIIIFRTMMPN